MDTPHPDLGKITLSYGAGGSGQYHVVQVRDNGGVGLRLQGWVNGAPWETDIATTPELRLWLSKAKKDLECYESTASSGVKYCEARVRLEGDLERTSLVRVQIAGPKYNRSWGVCFTVKNDTLATYVKNMGKYGPGTPPGVKSKSVESKFIPMPMTLPKPPKASEFKVGDKVEYLGTVWPDLQGKVGTVEKISYDEGKPKYHVQFPGHHPIKKISIPGSLVLATPVSTPTLPFKVGDKVVVIEAWDEDKCSQGPPVGTKAEVTALSNDPTNQCGSICIEWSPNGWKDKFWTAPTHLKKLEEVSRLKPGDLVEVIETGDKKTPTGGPPIGSVLKVMKLTPGSYFGDVLLEYEAYGWYTMPSKLKKLNPKLKGSAKFGLPAGLHFYESTWSLKYPISTLPPCLACGKKYNQHNGWGCPMPGGIKTPYSATR